MDSADLNAVEIVEAQAAHRIVDMAASSQQELLWLFAAYHLHHLWILQMLVAKHVDAAAKYKNSMDAAVVVTAVADVAVALVVQTVGWCCDDDDVVDAVLLYRQSERTHGRPTHSMNMTQLRMATDVHCDRQEFHV